MNTKTILVMAFTLGIAGAVQISSAADKPLAPSSETAAFFKDVTYIVFKTSIPGDEVGSEKSLASRAITNRMEPTAAIAGSGRSRARSRRLWLMRSVRRNLAHVQEPNNLGRCPVRPGGGSLRHPCIHSGAEHSSEQRLRE